jgi:hypothetical protein
MKKNNNDNDFQIQGELGQWACMLEKAKRTRFKNIYSKFWTHYNCFQEQIKYNENNKIEYTISDINGNVVKDISIEYKKTEYSDNDYFDIIIQSETRTKKLFSFSFGDLMHMIKYRKPKLYEKISAIKNKTEKIILPIGNMIFENSFLTLPESFSFKIIHSSTENIINPTILYQKYYIATAEQNRNNILITDFINNFYTMQINLDSTGQYTFVFEDIASPIINFLIKSEANNIKSVVLESNDNVHEILKSNTLLDYNNVLHDTNFDPENKYDIFFQNFGDVYDFGYAAGKFYGTPSKKLIISGEKNKSITIIFNYMTEIHAGKDHLTVRELFVIKPNYDNYYPLTKKNVNEYVEGYWFNSNDEQRLLPFPKKTDVNVDTDFLEKLEITMSKYKPIMYFGPSGCRICNEYCGSLEYVINNDNVKFIFPEGIMHYYKEHNVQPSTEFKNFIMNIPIQN